MFRGIGIELQYTYLTLDLVCLAGPLLLSFDKKVAFYKRWRALIFAALPVSLLYLVWDIIFTERGIWSFNAKYLIGWEWQHLPLEEWIFFIAIPYSSVFIYECLVQYFPKSNKRLSYEHLAWHITSILVFAIAFWHSQHLYTLVTFGLLGITLSLLRWSAVRFTALLASWTICLLPMAWMNGALTSLPIVSYNNSENIGLRLGSIPVEDFFYHLLYMAAIIGLYEYKLKRNH